MKNNMVWTAVETPLKDVHFGQLIAFRYAQGEDEPEGKKTTRAGVLFGIDMAPLSPQGTPDANNDIPQALYLLTLSAYPYGEAPTNDDRRLKVSERDFPYVSKIGITARGTISHGLDKKLDYTVNLHLVRVPLTKENLGIEPKSLLICGDVSQTRLGKILFARAQQYPHDILESPIESDLGTLRRLSQRESPLARVITQAFSHENHLGTAAFDPPQIRNLQIFLAGQHAQLAASEAHRSVKLPGVFLKDIPGYSEDDLKIFADTGALPKSREPWQTLISLMEKKHNSTNVKDIWIFDENELQDLLKAIEDVKGKSVEESFRLLRVLSQFAPGDHTRIHAFMKVLSDASTASKYEQQYPEMSKYVRESLTEGTPLHDIIQHLSEQRWAINNPRQAEKIIPRLIIHAGYLFSNNIPVVEPALASADTPGAREDETFKGALVKISVNQIEAMYSLEEGLSETFKRVGLSGMCIPDARRALETMSGNDVVEQFKKNPAKPRTGRPKENVRQFMEAIKPDIKGYKILESYRVSIGDEIISKLKKALDSAVTGFREDKETYAARPDQRTAINRKYGLG